MSTNTYVGGGNTGGSTASDPDQSQASLVSSRVDSAIQAGLDSLGSLSSSGTSSGGGGQSGSITGDSTSSHGFGDSAAVKEFGGAQKRSSTGGFDKGLGGPNSETAMGKARGQGGPGLGAESEGVLSSAATSISDTVSSLLGGDTSSSGSVPPIKETSNAALREGGVQHQSRTGQAMSGVHGGHADRT